MLRAVLTRSSSTDEGTFGILEVGKHAWFTLELPNRDNQPNLSCIPVGIYDCVWSYSPTLKRYAYIILDVPNRSGIRIHSANFGGDQSKGFKKQLNGCIALGERVGRMDRQKALLLSKPAIRKFEEFMKQQNFELEIK